VRASDRLRVSDVQDLMTPSVSVISSTHDDAVARLDEVRRPTEMIAKCRTD
jgi:hypothetical protein